MRRHYKFATLIASLTFVSTALAHDFWVQPAKFHPAVNESVGVHLHVGHAGDIQDIARNPQRIEKFIKVGPDGLADITGADDQTPAGSVQPTKPGLYVIGFRSKPSFIELAAPDFEQYLKDEGLDAIIAARKAAGESDSPGKESYSRCAKTMINVGAATITEADRTLNFRLELIALKNPLTIKAGHELPLQLHFEGKPCPGVLVKLKDPTSKNETAIASARTDEHGKVSLKLDSPGLRLINAVHMIPAATDNAQGAQWESLWASMTFEVTAKPE